MTNSRLAVFFAALALLLTSSGNADAQKVDMNSTSIKQQVLSLNRTNNGQHVAATVGQQIEITLGTIGPGHYGTPQISSPAIRFNSVAFPTRQTPGGPTQIYIFEVAGEGEAEVKIPHTYYVAFTVTIQVGSAAAGNPS